MYRYYGIIRAFAGTGLASQSVYVYSDATGSTLAPIYNASGQSISNPTTTNARGAIDVYSPRGALWYKVAGDTVVQPLPRTGTGDIVNVKDFGAKGDGETDDTDAFQAAIDEIAAYGSSGLTYKRPTLYIPPGIYLVDGFDINFREFCVRGAGAYATTIVPSGSKPVFSLGTFTTTPSDPWVGTAENSEFWDFTIRDPSKSAIASVGVDQVATGIQDNGCGWMKLHNLRFDGLLRGVYAPYGHDFAWYYGCDFYKCTTGIYYGPGSQQIHHYGTVMALCQRMVVIEGAPQGSFIGCSFNESKTRDIDIQCPATLESGVTTLTPKSEMTWSFIGCWFETGAGWNTGWEPLEHVRIGSTSETATVRGIRFHDLYLVSGTTGMGDTTNHYFVNVEKGKFVTFDGVLVQGAYIDAFVKTTTSSYTMMRVRDYKTVDGYTPIPVYASFEVGNTYAGWIEESALPTRISGASAAPTSGYHARGEVCLNTLPDPGENVGWICVSSGTPGTWKSIGTIAS